MQSSTAAPSADCKATGLHHSQLDAVPPVLKDADSITRQTHTPGVRDFALLPRIKYLCDLPPGKPGLMLAILIFN